MNRLVARALRGLRSALDPRPWLHVVRLVHFYNYSHVSQLRRASVGRDVAIAPNVSFRCERIQIGARSHIGEYSSLWAGESTGEPSWGGRPARPEVDITASNYQTRPGEAIMRQPGDEADVVIGRDVGL